MCRFNKTQVSPHDPTKLAIYSIWRPEDGLISNCGQTFKKTVCFDNIVHFIDDENIVSYVDFDCGITFYPETLSKIRQIKREQNYISRSCKKHKYTSGSNQLNCSIDKQHSCNCNIFLNPYNLWDMVPAAFISLNHTIDTYSVSSQYPHLKTHQSRTDSHPVFSSLRTMDSKRKEMRVSFAFFPRKFLPDGRVNKTVATVEELSELWKPGTMDGNPPFVMNCNGI